MANAIYHLQHGSIGKATHAPGTARAHANYILRQSACDKVVSVNFSTNPHAIKREVDRHEAELTRKNARVADKVLLALPQCMGVGERVETTRAFLWQLTDGGKTRAFAAIHDIEGEKPHVHVFLIDRDENGKSVAMLSASPRDRARAGFDIPNATEWLRDLWEKRCNSSLEQYGYEFRIDRSARRELEIAPTCPDVPLAHDEANDAPMEPQQEAAVADIEDDRDALKRMSPEEMAEFVGEIAYDDPEPDLPTRIRRGLDADLNLSHLNQAKDRIAALERALEQAHAEADVFRERERDARRNKIAWDKAHEREAGDLERHRTSDGRLRGMTVKLFRWELHSPARKKALEQQQRAELSKSQFDKAAVDHQDAHRLEIQAEKRIDDADTSLSAAQHALDRTVATFGDDMDFEKASFLLASDRLTQFRDLTGAEIYAEFELGSITADEASRACEIVGDTDRQAMIEQRQRQEIEQELDDGHCI